MRLGVWRTWKFAREFAPRKMFRHDPNYRLFTPKLFRFCSNLSESDQTATAGVINVIIRSWIVHTPNPALMAGVDPEQKPVFVRRGKKNYIKRSVLDYHAHVAFACPCVCRSVFQERDSLFLGVSILKLQARKICHSTGSERTMGVSSRQ